MVPRQPEADVAHTHYFERQAEARRRKPMTTKNAENAEKPQPAVASSDLLAELQALNAKVEQLSAMHQKATAERVAAEAAMQPLVAQERRAAGDEIRGRCELNAWWRKNRAQYELANEQAHARREEPRT
jgi:hypothetical protein